MNFGDALRRFREERGLSLRELSAITGVDHAYIHRLEISEKANPTDDMIDKLARGLKLSPQKKQILALLAGGVVLEDDLFDMAIEMPGRMLGITALAQMSFRGAKPRTRADWEKKLEAIEQVIGNGNVGGDGRS